MAWRRIASFTGLAVGLVIFAMTSAPALAATSTGGNGLKISPVATDLTMNPGDTHTVNVTVQNVTKSPITLQVIINDFTAGNDETGAPALLLDPNQSAPGHSLKQFIAPIGNITLKAGEEKAVNAVITIPKNTPGGGYYGAVRFAPAAGGNNSNVTLSASIASLVLVRVPGNYKEDLQLASFDVEQGGSGPRVVFTSSNNLMAVARFRDDGDVQEQPFGKVILKRGNNQLASYEINDTIPRGNVLPDSVRRFTVKLDKVGVLGKYTLVGNFGYGTKGQLIGGTTTFYVVPVGLTIAILAVIAIILFFVFGFPRLMRSYNRRVLQKAGRR